MSAKPLRDTMPATAAWIDDLREAFGKEAIDPPIRAGMAGRPCFRAVENGIEIGVPLFDSTGRRWA
jgi:hypothetical protein